MKQIYKAWVSNTQGAVEDIKVKNNTNKREILDYVRRTYGAGWTLHIRDIFGGDDILTNTLRN